MKAITWPMMYLLSAGLSGTRMSPRWILLELRVVTTTGAKRCAKLQSKSSPPTNQHPTFFYLPVAQPTVSKHWRENREQHLAYENNSAPEILQFETFSAQIWHGLSPERFASKNKTVIIIVAAATVSAKAQQPTLTTIKQSRVNMPTAQCCGGWL